MERGLEHDTGPHPHVRPLGGIPWDEWPIESGCGNGYGAVLSGDGAARGMSGMILGKGMDDGGEPDPSRCLPQRRVPPSKPSTCRSKVPMSNRFAQPSSMCLEQGRIVSFPFTEARA